MTQCFKTAVLDLKNMFEIVMNSIFKDIRRFETEYRQSIRDIEQRAEQIKQQGDQEEIKEQGEKDKTKGSIISLEEEVEKMKKTSKRLRDYDWKEELEMIHRLLKTRFSLLLTNTGD